MSSFVREIHPCHIISMVLAHLGALYIPTQEEEEEEEDALRGSSAAAAQAERDSGARFY